MRSDPANHNLERHFKMNTYLIEKANNGWLVREITNEEDEEYPPGLMVFQNDVGEFNSGRRAAEAWREFLWHLNEEIGPEELIPWRIRFLLEERDANGEWHAVIEE